MHLWLGAWPNGTAMGAGESLYFSQGQEIEAGFDAVVDCPGHAQYAEVVTMLPKDLRRKTASLSFGIAQSRDGRTVPEAITALQEWSKYASGRGTNRFAAMLFGLAGLPDDDADYTFKDCRGLRIHRGLRQVHGRLTRAVVS